MAAAIPWQALVDSYLLLILVSRCSLWGCVLSWLRRLLLQYRGVARQPQLHGQPSLHLCKKDNNMLTHTYESHPA